MAFGTLYKHYLTVVVLTIVLLILVLVLALILILLVFILVLIVVLLILVLVLIIHIRYYRFLPTKFGMHQGTVHSYYQFLPETITKGTHLVCSHHADLF